MMGRRDRRAVRSAVTAGSRAWRSGLRWLNGFPADGIAVGLVAAVMLVVALFNPEGAPAAPPANFSDTLVVSGFSTIPTDVTVMADGRLLITTQGGIVSTFKSGSLTTALNFASRVCSNLERGMFGVALDPAFASNHFVYLSYSFNKHGTCINNSPDSPVNRVSRFHYDPATTKIDTGSEVVLLDNMPSPGGGHNVGDIVFAPDGTLVISIGDGSCDLTDGTKCGPQNTNARKMNLLLGKILRITKDGGIPADNPFQGNGTARCNVNGQTAAGTICREIYATGFRNPFRIAVDPNISGLRIHADDTGQNTWEEVNNVVAAGDYGWSVCEGRFQTGSTSTDCPLSGARDPLFSYGHGDCNAVTGGAFVPNGVWPSAYDGKYLFGDYTCDRIWVLNQSSGSATRTDFATGVDLISMAFGPSGSTQALYYTTLGGQVRKIQYTGNVNRPPEAKATATPTFGALPLKVAFDGSGSSDPDHNALTFDWNFGDGSAHASGAAPHHTYTVKKVYTVTLTVNDGRGGTDKTTLKIDAGNTRPQPAIESPASSATFSVGQQITLKGRATDAEDGTLPASALTWEVIKHHDTHTHPFLPPTQGNNVQFTAPDPEDLLAATNSYLEIRLTATDSNGLTRTISQNFQPRKVDLTFATDPNKFVVTVEGVELKGPAVITAWAGWQLDVETAGAQIDSAGQAYNFDSWSDGGKRAHRITAPSSPTTYTARFSLTKGPSFVPVADATVREANPTGRYGRATTLQVAGGSGPDVASYLKFEVVGLGGPPTQATLWLFVQDGTTNGPAIFKAGNSWTESEITWNNRPSSIGSALRNKGEIPANRWVAYDVSGAVTGNGTYSFVLVGESADVLTVTSREGTSRRPMLVLRAGSGGDSVAPAEPQSLVATATAWNRIRLTWDAATDNVGVTGYDIFRDGVLLTSVGKVTTFTDTSVVDETTYQYRIRARDAAGNVSSRTDPVSVTTPVRTEKKTFVAEADARVQESNPTTRYGTSLQLRAEGGADPEIESYLRFNVAGLNGPVQRATLRVFIPDEPNFGTTDGPAAFKASNSWDESTITWSNRPARSTSPRSDKGVLAPGTWVDFDVTPYVTGNGKVTLVLAGASADIVVFSSREGEEAPQLIVVAAVTGGASVAETDEPSRRSGSPEGEEEPTSNSDGSLGEPLDELFVAFDVKVGDPGAEPLTLAQMEATDGRPALTLLVTEEGELAFRAGANGRTTVVGAMTPGEWHRVQVHVRVGRADGLLEIWLDGAPVYDKRARLGSARIASVHLNETATNVAFDNVAIDAACIDACPDAPEPTAEPTTERRPRRSEQGDSTATPESTPEGDSGAEAEAA